MIHNSTILLSGEVAVAEDSYIGPSVAWGKQLRGPEPLRGAVADAERVGRLGRPGTGMRRAECVDHVDVRGGAPVISS